MYYDNEKYIAKNVRSLISTPIEKFLWRILKNYYEKEFSPIHDKHTFSIKPHPDIYNCLSIYHSMEIDKTSNVFCLRDNEKITINVYIEYKNGYFVMFL